MTLPVVGIIDSVHRADVASPYAYHADQAVRFPLPANDEVTSHPVKAWNFRKATAFSVSKCLSHSCCVMIP